MKTSKLGMMLGLTSICSGITPAHQPEKPKLLPNAKHQFEKLNKAEAKRYRKKEKAILNARRTAAGMIC